MSIHVILGKPGSGKSLYATSRVIRELIETQRNIVTNLPLRPDRLNEYVNQTYPQSNTRFVERVRVLADDEIGSFWKFRGPGEDTGAQGVAYFLDEAHIAFNARDWASIGRGALHYLSQHRKLGDIVWPITQSPGNLDKQFRSVAEDFTVLKNEYTAKYGPFRGRGRFVRKTYLSEPTSNAEPFETATFSLDTAGIASCYDTAKGIGVHGNKADIGRRAKGIPIMWVIPGALALGALCAAIPYGMAKLTSRALTGKASEATAKLDEAKKSIDGVTGKVTPALPATAPQAGQAPGQVAPPPPPQQQTHTPAPLEPEQPTLEGYYTNNGHFYVQFSDGTVLTEESGLIAQITETAVLMRDGKKHLLKRPKVTPEMRSNASPVMQTVQVSQMGQPISLNGQRPQNREMPRGTAND